MKRVHEQWIGLMGYAIAMALLEACVVIYMRQLYYPDDPLVIFPLQFLDRFDPRIELSRELATLLMIVAVAFVGERRSFPRWWAAVLLLFGAWDLFYYVWLKVLIGWPVSWLEWDILFLIPRVWLGPWICPALIAALFLCWGSLGLSESWRVTIGPKSITLFLGGVLVGLFVFMEPAERALQHGGREALVQFLPGAFSWKLFLLSWLMMAFGLGSGLCRELPTGGDLCEKRIPQRSNRGSPSSLVCPAGTDPRA